MRRPIHPFELGFPLSQCNNLVWSLSTGVDEVPDAGTWSYIDLWRPGKRELSGTLACHLQASRRVAVSQSEQRLGSCTESK